MLCVLLPRSPRCTKWIFVGLLAVWITGCSQHYEEGAHPPGKPLPTAQGAADKPTVSGDEPGDPAAAISGVIRVAESLTDSVPPGATLYIIGRQGGRAGPPHAFKRLPLPRFPYRYTLTAADAGMMTGQAPSSGALPALHVVAKIDQDGMVGVQPGDMEGSCPRSPLSPGERDGDIVIDQVH